MELLGGVGVLLGECLPEWTRMSGSGPREELSEARASREEDGLPACDVGVEGFFIADSIAGISGVADEPEWAM